MKSDFQTGATLVVKLPEKDLDKKAFYTIQANCPNFLLPFHHRSVDEQVELAYQIGKSSKLVYLSGTLSPKIYAELLHSTISPLLECEDWFLTPYSFVFDNNHIYYDDESKTVKYLYIPSVKQISELESLTDMINALAEHIRVADADLENKVLRALRKDFNPTEFIEMLKPYHVEAVKESTPAMRQTQPYSQQTAQPIVAPQQQQPEVAVNQVQMASQEMPQPMSAPPSAPSSTDDIVIDIGGKSKGKQKKVKTKPPPKEKRGGLFGGKSKEKQAAKGGLFGGKPKEKETQTGIMMGAAAEMQSSPYPNSHPYTQPQPHPQVASQHVNVQYGNENDGSTEILDEISGFTGLSLVSRVSLPERITVSIEPGRVFSIGRYSVSIGIKQSDFEFGEQTKEVSRRHAVIERSGEGYTIVDIGSRAGTFLNDERIIPNMPHKLSDSDKVSFGRAGADYEWKNA